jgi:iron complex transport system substrate-binding protein
MLRILAAAAIAFASVLPAQAKPQRVMSLNGCTDLLVLQMVPKARVVSVTYRARDAARAFAPGLADGIPTNDGRAEEVVAFRPDLVVAGRFTTPATRALVRRARIPLVELDDANSFADIRRIVRELGAATGEPARAEAMIARMDAVLADLAARPPSRVRTVAAWSGGGAVPGRGSLADAVIVAAGAVNIAARTDDARYGDFDVEALLRARPDALLQGDPRLTHPALRVEQGRHPLVRRLYAGRTIATPESLYACGLPQTADAALALRRALDGLAP